MNKPNVFVSSFLLMGCLACGSGGDRDNAVVDGAPSVEEAANANASDLKEAAALLVGTYRSTNTVTSNTCPNDDSNVGDVTTETISLSQQESDDLILTVEGSAAAFKGKANENKFTLIRETSFNLGNCSFEQSIIISGAKMEEGSLQGTLNSSQIVEGNCGSQKSCEIVETFVADPV